MKQYAIFNDGLGFDQDNIISDWSEDLEAVKKELAQSIKECEQDGIEEAEDCLHIYDDEFNLVEEESEKFTYPSQRRIKKMYRALQECKDCVIDLSEADDNEIVVEYYALWMLGLI